MKNEIDISVIIPVYNTDKYLDKCLQSVVNQTFKNIEIIIIDDNSKDKSSVIIEKYKKQDHRIRSFNAKNIGAGRCRNIGIKNSKANYITFVDSDDEIKPDMLEDLYSLAKKENSDMVVSDYIRVDEGRNHIGKSISFEHTKEAFIKDLVRIHVLSVMWRILYKKALFTESEMLFIERDIYNEDTHLLYRLAHKAHIISFTDKIHYYWLIRDGSKTHSISEKHFDDMIFVLNSMHEYITDNNITYVSKEDMLEGIYSSLKGRFQRIKNKIVLDNYSRRLHLINKNSIANVKSAHPDKYYNMLLTLKTLYSSEEIVNTGLFLEDDAIKFSRYKGDKTSALISSIKHIEKKYGKSIYIYGGGDVFKQIIPHLKNFNIKGIIDKNYKKMSFEGYIVGDKDILKENSIVLVASYAFAKEMKQELIDYAKEKNMNFNILNFYDILDMEVL